MIEQLRKTGNVSALWKCAVEILRSLVVPFPLLEHVPSSQQEPLDYVCLMHRFCNVRFQDQLARGCIEHALAEEECQPA
jgi:hypothetical protein